MAGIFKAYDIRGTYPDQIHPELAARIATATVEILGARRLVVGRDMRESGPAMRDAVVEALLHAPRGGLDLGGGVGRRLDVVQQAVDLLVAEAQGRGQLGGREQRDEEGGLAHAGVGVGASPGSNPRSTIWWWPSVWVAIPRSAAPLLMSATISADRCSSSSTSMSGLSPMKRDSASGGRFDGGGGGVGSGAAMAVFEGPVGDAALRSRSGRAACAAPCSPGPGMGASARMKAVASEAKRCDVVIGGSPARSACLLGL